MPWHRHLAGACPSKGSDGQEAGGEQQERCRSRARQPAPPIDGSNEMASAIEHHDQAERPREYKHATCSLLHKRSEERKNQDQDGAITIRG